MDTQERPQEDLASATADGLKRKITARYPVRLHAALILVACFVAGLGVTKGLLMIGVHAMWIRYSLALIAAYLTFLLGVWIWLWFTGFDRPMLPSRRRSLTCDADLPYLGGSGGGGSGGSFSLPGFRGGGGGSGGGGASAGFSGSSLASSGSSESTGGSLFSGGHSSGGGGGSLDLGDDGWVLLALLALLAAVFGGVAWLIYAAPTILGDAAFAALLSAGLVRSTRHITSGGWVSSVVGHTWIAFGAVFALALAFALVAQHRFPDAQTMFDVVSRL